MFLIQVVIIIQFHINILDSRLKQYKKEINTDIPEAWNLAICVEDYKA